MSVTRRPLSTPFMRDGKVTSEIDIEFSPDGKTHTAARKVFGPDGKVADEELVVMERQ